MERRAFRVREKQAIEIPRSWLLGWKEALRYRKYFYDIERYCMFVGYPRSGHSLVGSLLNAHPEVVIAHELNALRYIRYGFSREQIFGLLIRRDQEFGALGREWSGYSYTVEGQSQGKWTRLRVIGDKRGRASTKLLGENPALLGVLKKRVALPVTVIHHIRNPFDNISTIARKGRVSLEVAAERYFRFVNWATGTIQEQSTAEVINSYHEDFIGSPQTELRRLISALGVSVTQEYLDACAKKVFPQARLSRKKVKWPSILTQEIEDRIQLYPHLKRYNFYT
ncbi:hypothetical protein CAI21_07935 [Alkalilimnicola ehrlichii]|uniref:Sulfotransferase family protein n=1 Tax=Alkalilimnicola ehrlichii TaxID=351052 RepID=A0A3E0WXD7_9GAMM|nr:sulfotransferase [Alkalilimnicola ehrlichii]RFA30120.1 hypothetical protein CAI21_07935 [Alkalilimnicola ehrlichii]RFA37468.1 hypothetical protein CAL65_09285 [Alkalilimnicola ehrlichii]